MFRALAGRISSPKSTSNTISKRGKVFREARRPVSKLKKGIMEEERKPNEPIKPAAPGQQGGQQGDREKEKEREKQGGGQQGGGQPGGGEQGGGQQGGR